MATEVPVPLTDTSIPFGPEGIKMVALLVVGFAILAIAAAGGQRIANTFNSMFKSVTGVDAVDNVQVV